MNKLEKKSFPDTDDLIDSFIEMLIVEKNLSENSLKGYSTDIRMLDQWASEAGLHLFELTKYDFRIYLAELYDEGYSKSTVNRRLSSIRSFFRFLKREGYEISNAFETLVSSKSNKHLPYVLSAEELEQLFSIPDKTTAEGERDYLMLELLYSLGCRISELSLLNIDSINFKMNEVKLFGKGRVERIVPIHKKALKEIDHYITHGRSELLDGKGKITQALLISTRANRMSPAMLRRQFEIIRDKAGLDEAITPHSMRHTYATDLLSGGADLRSVQELLGHKSLSTTQIYTHLSIENLKSAVKQAHPRA